MRRTIAERVKQEEARIARLKQRYSSSDLVKAIENRHTGDICVPECKDGPTFSGQHRRLDVWVMLRTWSPITMIGYEIKVSRSDWLNDKKFLAYLPLCHYLYIVALPGVVHAEELPADVGLVEPVGNLRLVTRRKAVYRNIELPGELLVYVLMCRTKITREIQDNADWRLRQLQEWVESKAEKQRLSYAVSSKIREVFADQERRLFELNFRCERLERIEKRLIELGFDPEKSVDLWGLNQRLKPEGADPEVIQMLSRAADNIMKACERLK